MKSYNFTGKVLLERETLQWADLRGTNLREADLQRAKFQGPIFQFNSGMWDVIFDGENLRIGYQVHKIEVWELFTDREIQVMHPNALEFWKTHKEFLLGIARQLLKDRPYDQFEDKK